MQIAGQMSLGQPATPKDPLTEDDSEMSEKAKKTHIPMPSASDGPSNCGSRTEGALHQEILEKLKHDKHQCDTHSISPPQYRDQYRDRALSLGSQDILATRYEADKRRVLAESAAYHAAMLKFANGRSPMNGGPLSNQGPRLGHADLMQRDALFLNSLGGRPRMDFMNPMAFMEQHMGRGEKTEGRVGESSSPPTDDSEGDPALDPLHSPSGGQWTYEEQFKQLYDMGNEPERKEFLDELFAYMQKKGSPVNRIPIMAKQTLDIYQLFKLVVSKGGLVEVINKKLWREITKGLNLPSSITSAAFTLRTQYMKYLYPYECEKYHFSSPAELQTAIDGNRREGRRPGFGYDLPGGLQQMPFYTPQTMSNTPPFFNPAFLNSPMANLLSSPMGSLLNNGPVPNRMRSGSFNSTGDRDENHLSPVGPGLSTDSPRLSAFSLARPLQDSDSMNREPKRMRTEAPPSPQPEPVEKTPAKPEATVTSTNIKISSQGSGKSEQDSLVITMDINGTMYQGILYAQPRDL